MERRFQPFIAKSEEERNIKEKGKFAQIDEIENAPGRIVKSYKVENLMARDEEAIHNLDDFRNVFLNNAAFLQKYTGNRLPKFDIVITGTQNEKQKPNLDDAELYIVMDEVTKEQLLTSEQKEQFCVDVENVILNACQSFRDTMVLDDDKVIGSFPDIKMENFIYGKAEGDKGPKTYFVDLYPIRMRKFNDFFNMAVNLMDDLAEFDGRYIFSRSATELAKLEKDTINFKKSQQ